MAFQKPAKQDVLRAAEVAVNVVLWVGVAIIAYGAISELTNEPWRPVERYIVRVAATLTLLLTALNAVTIYLGYDILSPASSVARMVAVPLVVVLCLIAIVLLWTGGIPAAVILGFAIVGLAWMLSRLIPPQIGAQIGR